MGSTPVPVREGAQMTSVTVDVHEVRLELRKPPALRGRVVTLVDTPGLNHTDLSDLEVLSRIENSLYALPFFGLARLIYSPRDFTQVEA
jgi:hypothetical protein